jgi:hypothetical protein
MAAREVMFAALASAYDDLDRFRTLSVDQTADEEGKDTLKLFGEITFRINDMRTTIKQHFDRWKHADFLSSSQHSLSLPNPQDVLRTLSLPPPLPSPPLLYATSVQPAPPPLLSLSSFLSLPPLSPSHSDFVSFPTLTSSIFSSTSHPELFSSSVSSSSVLSSSSLVSTIKMEPELDHTLQNRPAAATAAVASSMIVTALNDISHLIAREFVDSALPQHVWPSATIDGGISDIGRLVRSDFVYVLSNGAASLFERARNQGSGRSHTLPPLPRHLARSCSRRQWVTAWTETIASFRLEARADMKLCGRFVSPDHLVKRPSSLGLKAGAGCFTTKKIRAGTILGPYGPAYCCLATEAAVIEANPISRAGFSTYAYATAFRHIHNNNNNVTGSEDPAAKDDVISDSSFQTSSASSFQTSSASSFQTSSASSFQTSSASSFQTSSGRNRMCVIEVAKSKRKTDLVFSSWGFDGCILGYMNSVESAASQIVRSTSNEGRCGGDGGGGGGDRKEAREDVDARSVRSKSYKCVDVKVSEESATPALNVNVQLSLNANVRFCEVLLWGQFPTVWAVASRDVEEDQELFVDYGAQYWRDWTAASSDRYLMGAFYRKTSAILNGLAPRFPLVVD